MGLNTTTTSNRRPATPVFTEDRVFSALTRAEEDHYERMYQDAIAEGRVH